MLNRIGMKTLFGAGTVAVAALMTMYSCNRPKGEQPKTELQIAQENYEKAQNVYAADSAQFVCMAKDSTALKEKLAQQQQMRADYLRISDDDTQNIGKQFDDYYKRLAERAGEEVPVDSNLVKMVESIEAAQLKVDIATGKIAQKSKENRDKALQYLEEVKQKEQREAERAKEQAKQDSIRQARLKNDPLHQKLLAERERLEKERSAVEKLKKLIEEQEKEEFEAAKLAKQLMDAKTKSRKDSIMQEFRKIQ